MQLFFHEFSFFYVCVCVQSPRTEAMSFLGSLLCFPNHLKEIYVLEPNSKELTVINCTDLKVSEGS